MKHAYVFPGQGAQFSGMGKTIYDSNEAARILLEEANDILGFRITNTMFLGEKVRYFLQDALDKEWIVDAFDPGRTIHQGEVYVTFPAEKAWVIEK